jgi:hypothetical protein
MSTGGEGIGGKAAADGLLRQSKDLVDGAGREERQLHLLDPLTPEEMAFAQEQLGPGAGQLAVMRHAREQRKQRGGRKPGSRNRRTDDFDRYIRQFGRDPAITLMEIQSTPPEVLVERSRMMDPAKRQMTYSDAQSLRVRCAETLMPYMHGKKPIAVEVDAKGDFNLLIPGVNIGEVDARQAADGTFVLDADYTELPGGGEEGKP